MHVTYGRGSVLLWRRCDKLCTSGFMDDVTFANIGQYEGTPMPLQRVTSLHRRARNNPLPAGSYWPRRSGAETARVHRARDAG